MRSLQSPGFKGDVWSLVHSIGWLPMVERVLLAVGSARVRGRAQSKSWMRETM